MEGTQTDIAAASALKVHKVTHNLHNVSCIKNLLNRCLINTSHSTKLQKKLTTPNTPPILGQCKKQVVKTGKNIELCRMKQWQVLRTIFPSFITENFEFVDYKESVNQLDYWLDERGYMSREDYKKGTVREYGFTEERVIQDFPIRGKAVYLHVRRRKWRDTEDGSIFTYNYELTEEGSRLTPEFVAFLKEED